ncbi:hypothetical protein [Vibrio sp. OPT24]|uniref:hypothetical protein n=1 Tax=Vibrio sp. OPT24 TaxID=2778643 RepID=UPI001881DE93|nr:hypothetical protein [Vibrio sp. OPT24]MBE8557182.1 hypothetical protein [Vibrio sp. OPT24]
MAWIGKDGKDDVAKLAVLGGNQVIRALNVVPGLAVTSRYHRVDYDLANVPTPDIVSDHVDFIERLTLIGYIDSYGGNDPLKPFVIVHSDDAAMSESLGKASPLVTRAGAKVSVSVA